MALRDALRTLNAAVEDLTSLHVQTYTGTIGVEVGDQAGFDNVREAVKAARTGDDATVTLVAEGYYRFDGDSYNFIASGDVPARAIELHQAAVEAGMATRRGLMEMVRDVFD